MSHQKKGVVSAGRPPLCARLCLGRRARHTQHCVEVGVLGSSHGVALRARSGTESFLGGGGEPTRPSPPLVAYVASGAAAIRESRHIHTAMADAGGQPAGAVGEGARPGPGRGGGSSRRKAPVPRPRSATDAASRTAVTHDAAEAQHPPAGPTAGRSGGSEGREGRGGGARSKRSGRGGRGRGGAGAAAGSSSAAKEWWSELEDEEIGPITLEPLNTLSYEPFELRLSDVNGHIARFDGKALAEYLCTSKNFVHPLSRAVITRDDCAALDAYLRRHKLGPSRVAKTFDDAQAALEAAARANTAEALLAQRLATAQALLQSFYSHSTRSVLNGGGFSRRQPATPVIQQEGNLTVLDDDAAMTRGADARAAMQQQRQRQQQQQRQQQHSHAVEEVVEHFPALPMPAAQTAPNRSAWATAASAAPTSAPAQEPRSRPSWWGHAAPSAPRVPTQQGTGSQGASAEDEARAQRRRQIAAAFGVSNPETRPSTFAASSAEAFTAETLQLARSEPDFVAEVERRFEEALRLNQRRVSMPPMSRSKRRLVHEVGAQWHIATHAYGEGASRHIDLFLVPGLSHFPTRHLSDAARLSAEAAAQATAAAAASRSSTGDDPTAVSRWQLTFSDVAAGVDIHNVLSPWADHIVDFALDAATGAATITLGKETAWEDARSRLGAGIRGSFSVVATDTAAVKRKPKSASVAASSSDPWAEEAGGQHIGAGPASDSGFEAPVSWEVLEQLPANAGRAAPPDLPPVRSSNRWGTLAEESEEEGVDAGSGSGSDDA